MQTDVLSRNFVATGATGIGLPRVRIKAIYYVATPVAGSISLRDGSATGVELVKLDTPAAAVSYYLIFPGQGVLFDLDPYLTISAVTSVTIFYA
jgi:uncharacterized membrane protein